MYKIRYGNGPEVGVESVSISSEGGSDNDDIYSVRGATVDITRTTDLGELRPCPGDEYPITLWSEGCDRYEFTAVCTEAMCSGPCSMKVSETWRTVGAVTVAPGHEWQDWTDICTGERRQYCPKCGESQE